MKVEIKSHYWPKTPELREIKLLVDGHILYSAFLRQDDIWDLAQQFRYLDQKLMEIGNKMDD